METELHHNLGKNAPVNRLKFTSMQFEQEGNVLKLDFSSSSQGVSSSAFLDTNQVLEFIRQSHPRLLHKAMERNIAESQEFRETRFLLPGLLHDKRNKDEQEKHVLDSFETQMVRSSTVFPIFPGFPPPGIPRTCESLAQNIVDAIFHFQCFDLEFYFFKNPNVPYRCRFSSAFFEGKSLRILVWASGGTPGVFDRLILLNELYFQIAHMNGINLKDQGPEEYTGNPVLNPCKFRTKPEYFLEAIFVVTGPRGPNSPPLHTVKGALTLQHLFCRVQSLGFRAAVKERVKQLTSISRFFNEMKSGHLGVLIERGRQSRCPALMVAERLQVSKDLSCGPVIKVSRKPCFQGTPVEFSPEKPKKGPEKRKRSSKKSASGAPSGFRRRLPCPCHFFNFLNINDGNARAQASMCQSRLDLVISKLPKLKQECLAKFRKSLALVPFLSTPLCSNPCIWDPASNLTKELTPRQLDDLLEGRSELAALLPDLENARIETETDICSLKEAMLAAAKALKMKGRIKAKKPSKEQGKSEIARESWPKARDPLDELATFEIGTPSWGEAPDQSTITHFELGPPPVAQFDLHGMDYRFNDLDVDSLSFFEQTI